MAFLRNTTYLKYGPLVLSDLKTLGYEMNPVYAGPDYLYTSHILHIEAVLNPALNSYILTPGLLVPAVSTTKGAMPTLEAIRHQLLQPQQYLEYGMGDTILLRSPLNWPTTRTDATGGPRVLSLSVSPWLGAKSAFVRLSIQTDLQECAKSNQSLLDALISHRWEAQSELDQDFRDTRYIMGKMVFDTGALHRLGRRPDDYRVLFPSTDSGYQRKFIRTKVSQDWAEYEYLIIDKEMDLIVRIPGVNYVTRIEAVRSFDLNKPGLEQAGFGLAGLMGQVASGVQGLFGSNNNTPNLSISGQNPYNNILPRTVNSLQVKVWGSRTATKNALTNVAVNIVQRVMNGVASNWRDLKTHMDWDLLGKFVNLEIAFTSGPITAVLQQADPNTWRHMFGANFFPAVEGVQDYIHSTPVQPPRPPRQNRGFFNSGLQTQTILHTPCSYPNLPPLERQAQEHIA